jgi:EAL domain-containing protein (putative c-di-GMP-specific phosphodiesterase class I)
MRHALEHHAFDVHFQPKTDRQRRIIGFEALARWEHPELGTVSPEQFIPVAEDTGLIVPLTSLILRRAFCAARTWNTQHDASLRIAVNLSPKLFVNHGVVAQVSEALFATQLDPACVELEITESVLLDDEQRAVNILQELSALGVQLAMDDFGTGYSSLSYLRRYPLQIIKIDRSLVHDMELGEDIAMIALAALTLGKSLRKTVVAEGVENAAQFELLSAHGCDEFQGYWLARPMSEQRVSELLRTSNELPVAALPA